MLETLYDITLETWNAYNAHCAYAPCFGNHVDPIATILHAIIDTIERVSVHR